MRYFIFLLVMALIGLMGCSMFSFSRQQAMQNCIIEMAKNDIPVDLAEEKCKDIYGNIHSEFRRDIIGDKNRR
jgi:hypothetical protein